MKRMIMLQKGMIFSDEEFLEIVSKYSSIPYNILLDKYFGEQQILIEEHYFRNIWTFLLKEKFNDIDYEEFLLLLKNNNNDLIKKIETLTDNKIEFFYYELI